MRGQLFYEGEYGVIRQLIGLFYLCYIFDVI